MQAILGNCANKEQDNRWCAEHPVNSERRLDLMEEMTPAGYAEGAKSETGQRENWEIQQETAEAEGRVIHHAD